MAKVTGDSIEINVPFALPFFGITEPTTLLIDKANLQLAVRIIVAICSIILFWPKIASAFGIFSGRDTDAERKEIQERIAKMEHERDSAQKQKSYALATGADNEPATPAQAAAGQQKESSKRRKA